MPYGTVEGLKDFLKVSATDTTYDDTYYDVLRFASQGVDTYCGRSFTQAAYTWYTSGTGRPEVLLPNRPVSTTGLTVYLDNNGYYGQGASAFPASTLLTAGSDYVLRVDGDGRSESGILLWLGAASSNWPTWRTTGVLTPGVAVAGWPVGLGNIKVGYTGGYATIPADIEAATYLLSQVLIAQTDNNAFQPTSETIGPYSVSSQQLSYFAREVFNHSAALARYRELAV